MKYIYFWIFALIITVMGCDLGPDSPRGFSLPNGDIEKGKLVFMKYQCLSCHKLAGVEQTDVIDNPDLSIRLGGERTQIKTYAELVTSVINPSHKFVTGYPYSLIKDYDKSKMKVFNDVMTVTELVDLVSFLQPKYELIPYRRTNYQHYGY